MNILLINSVCKKGSTGTMIYGLFNFLSKNNHNPYLCYGRGEIIAEKNIYRIDSKLEVYIHVLLARIFGKQGFYSNRATKKVIRIIEKHDIQCAILFNLHGYYINEFKLLNYLKKKHIKTIYIMPDEYAALGKCCYSNNCEKFKIKCENCDYIRDYPKSFFFDKSEFIFNKKKEIYNNFSELLFVGPQININKIKTSSIVKNPNTKVVDWGIDITHTYKAYPREMFRKKYNIPIDKKVVLAVGPVSLERKGIRKFFFECAKQTQDKNLFFVNVGYDGDLSACPENYMPLGYIHDQVILSEIYSCADLFVMPSLADTMPLTVLISLACGTPVCCFDSSGFPFLADETCAYFIPTANRAAMYNFIENVPIKTKEKSMVCRKYAKQRYSDERFYTSILNCLF